MTEVHVEEFSPAILCILDDIKNLCKRIEDLAGRIDELKRVTNEVLREVVWPSDDEDYEEDEMEVIPKKKKY